MVALCAMVLLLDGLDMIVAPISVPAMAADWQLAPARFGIALSASVFGMAIGAAFITPLGDRYGRRPMVIAGFAVGGLTCLLVPLVQNLPQLVGLRFITGLGLGVSLANALTLASEYAPPQLRSRVLSCVYAMSALGGAFGGLVAPPLLANWGWQGVYVFGGLLPLAMLPVLFWGLAESRQFLEARASREAQAAVSMDNSAGSLHRLRLLLAAPYRATTLLVWSLFFLSTFCTYVISSWLPTLLNLAGWTVDNAVRAVTVFSFGGIFGGFFLGWMVDRQRVMPALVLGFGAVAGAIAALHVVPAQLTAWMLLIGLMGAGTMGVAYALTAFAAIVYPTSLRASGIGAAGALGRFGATIAPLAGSWLLAQGLAALHILSSLILPMACALLLIALFGRRAARSGEA
ncbi:MFS transporter [Mangrovimicrobium sediminis]|uniref:MFS transporter n=1 Tax=Mangrovimicrobium sediminis TaxID=2562682 RepID=A0A4Z0LYP2_9GAMM|nr:MFS transporter [Haliea sp. SAOS-164]TGD72286.1 MFS transporter [Haliea sp. SAOS-164]